MSVGLTVCYTFRLMYYSLTGDYNYFGLSMLSESSFIMLKGMGGLIMFVVFSGSMLQWLMFSTPYFICLPFLFKVIAFLMVGVGMWFGYQMAKFSLKYTNMSLKFLPTSTFLGSTWNMPNIYTLGVNFYPISMGGVYTKSFDQGWLEYYGGQNLSISLSKISLVLQFMSINHLKIYFMLIIVWLGF